MIKNVAVFCGSNVGSNKSYTTQTIELAKSLVSNNLDLVYGGGNTGQMGIIAQNVKAMGGKVVGIITHQLEDIEIPYKHCDELILVETMYERKNLLIQKSDAIVAMPGALGTLDELFEAMVLNQLEIIQKPVILFNIDGFYYHLIQFLERSRSDGFLKEKSLDLLVICEDVPSIINTLNNWKPIA